LKTDKLWATANVDANVVSASLNAMVDGFEYALIEHAQVSRLCDDAFDDEGRKQGYAESRLIYKLIMIMITFR
jgi:hypothetical protein